MSGARWNPCVEHRGDQVEEFIRAYFSRETPSTLFVGGAGFDPRAAVFPGLLSRNNTHVSGLFLKEERPNPDQILVDRAAENTGRLAALFKGTVNLLPPERLSGSGGPELLRQPWPHSIL
jgi:hypothetical protein